MQKLEHRKSGASKNCSKSMKLAGLLRPVFGFPERIHADLNY